MSATLGAAASFFLPNVKMGGALAPSEWRTLVHVAEVLMDGGPHGVSAEDIANNVEQFLIAGRSRRAWRVRILLRCIELLPMARFHRPFSRLTLPERRRVVVEQWITGRGLGRICAKVKNLIVLGAYGDPRAAGRTGYVPVNLRRRFLDADQQQQQEQMSAP